MKRILFAFLMATAFSFYADAQVFDEEVNNVGVKLNMEYSKEFDNINLVYGLFYERGITDFSSDIMALGVGLNLGLSTGASKLESHLLNRTRIDLLARAALHFGFVERLDLYAAGDVGVYIDRYGVDYERVGKTYFSWNNAIGARYFFSEIFGVGLEGGYGFHGWTACLSFVHKF